jgi:thiamine-phosphate pyrophosphorylase
VWATPTKPGRAAVGVDLVRYAAGTTGKTTGKTAVDAADATVEGSLLPWFAIGGIDLSNVEQVLAAGARRIVVVRAITDADDPAGAAKSLLEALDAG